MIVRIVIAALVALSLVAGCADRKAGDKQTVGALGGAAVGGLLGAQVGGGKGQLAATAAGALLGALVGSEIGGSMDEAARMKAREAFDQAAQAPMGQTITWDNPNSGNSGTVTPTREGTAARGDY